MTEKNSIPETENLGPHAQSGCRPWFFLNLILFPVPAHFSLLRFGERGLGNNILHLGVSLFLFLLLITAALLQIFFPDIGRFWMILPALSGIGILLCRRIPPDAFTAVNLVSLLKERWTFIGGFVLLLTILNAIPLLNLIELNQKAAVYQNSWFVDLPPWQDALIMLSGLIALFFGYTINSPGGVSINRGLILYACYSAISGSITLIFYLATRFLKIQAGFGISLTAGLLAAILALDFLDAKTIGQFIKRYFLLTCTKGFTFLFLWLCLLGLPQKCASVFSEFHYNKAKPSPVRISPRFLVFDQQDHFTSAHHAARRIRVLSTKAVLDKDGAALDALGRVMENHSYNPFPDDSHIRQTSAAFANSKLDGPGMDFGTVPLFRPVEGGWDVMLAALLKQGSIEKGDMDQYIARFKKILPDTSEGVLPEIDKHFSTRYVALASGTEVDFIIPEYEYFEDLAANGFAPVLSIRLAGKKYWVALLHMDRKAQLAWFRIETPSTAEKSIRQLFDAGKHESLRDEIISRTVIALPLDYLRKTMALNGSPIIVFSKRGLGEKKMPQWAEQGNLDAVKGAIGAVSGKQRIKKPKPPGEGEGPFMRYANYRLTTAWIKSRLRPRRHGQELFSEAGRSPAPPEVDILGKIQDLIKKQTPLYESDRLDIAALLAKNNHVKAVPELFVALAAPKPQLSDLIDCSDAFAIGRGLYLLGHGKAAHEYLELAFLRHPYFSEYELWYRISGLKQGLPPSPLLSPLDRKPAPALYYKTLADLRNDNEAGALKRLTKAVKKDSHDIMANHLLDKYFNRPLDTRHFFPTPEGL